MRYSSSHGSYYADFSSPGNHELDTLMRVLHAKDDYTARHCQQVRDLTVALGKHLELTPAELDRTAVAALYHDVGKVGITRQVLNKPASLNRHEWRAIRAHPILGHELVSSLCPADRLAKIIRQHHEAWDGSGYPDRLQKGEILLEARVLHVCDVYDALVNDRPYRKAYTHSRAVKMLEDGIGTHFQPEIAEPFIQLARQVYRAA